MPIFFTAGHAENAEYSVSVIREMLPLDCQIQRNVADSTALASVAGVAIRHERFVIY